MDPAITARHCDITDALRDRATTVLERLGQLAERPMETAVTFDVDAGRPVVELRLHVARGEVMVASADGADHRSALDRAEEKLRKQIERAAGRARDVRHTSELKV